MRTVILIVDDDDDIRSVVRRVLEPFGEIVEASNGKEGLRLLADAKPSLMLLDMSMPEMDGLAVLKAARALAPSVPVVMLTGGSDLSTAKRALDDGANAYMTKPFEAEVLCAEVRRLIDGAAGAASGGRPWSVRK